MTENESWQSGPSTLWVMAGRHAPDDRVVREATPLPIAVTAAGLVSALRLGPEALERSPARVAHWDAIRSHYPQVADWIDDDAAGARQATPSAVGPAGRMSHAGVDDYLGLLDSSDDVDRWLATEPDYWVTAGASVDAATRAAAEFRRLYQQVAVIGPITIYRRLGRQA